MDTNGFYGDTFSSGFGDFYTAKRSKLEESLNNNPFPQAEKFYNNAPLDLQMQKFISKVKLINGKIKIRIVL